MPHIEIAAPPLSNEARTHEGSSELVNRVLAACEAVSDSSEAEKAPTPAGLCVNLLEHQQQALGWMLHRERQELPPDVVRLQLPSASGELFFGRSLFLLEPPSRGGILAQQMGMGKSVEVLALTLSDLPAAGEPRGTLIVWCAAAGLSLIHI